MQSIVNLKCLVLMVFLAGQVIGNPVQPQQTDDKVKEIIASSGVEAIVEDESDHEIGSMVKKNTEALTKHMVESSGLKNMASAVDLSPLKVDDIVDTHNMKKNIETSSDVDQRNVDED